MRPMPLACNIDARGKRARLINGLILLVIGLCVAIFWAARTGDLFAWIVSAVCLLLGAFCVFEARAGWCVMRAMGFKTKL
jgi:hypothetical protein